MRSFTDLLAEEIDSGLVTIKFTQFRVWRKLLEGATYNVAAVLPVATWDHRNGSAPSGRRTTGRVKTGPQLILFPEDVSTMWHPGSYRVYPLVNQVTPLLRQTRCKGLAMTTEQESSGVQERPQT